MSSTFREFVDSKQRSTRKHLNLVKKIFEKEGFRINDKLGERDDPHIFVFNPDRNLSFDGIRVYEIGGDVAYRVQKESETHPFGKAYPLKIEKMFDDLQGEEDMDDNKIGQEIIKSVTSEIKDFFEKSFKAEKEGPDKGYDPLGQVHMRTTGTDYGDKVGNNQNR